MLSGPTVVIIFTVLSRNVAQEIHVSYLATDFNHGAVTMGIEQAIKDGYHIGLNITYSQRSALCGALYATQPALDSLTIDGADAILGPSCALSCLDTAKVVTYYSRPFLPINCPDGIVNNKTHFDTTLRIAGSLLDIGLGFSYLYNHFQWRKTVILAETSYDMCSYGKDIIIDYLLKGGAEGAAFIDIAAEPSPEDLINYANLIKQRGRIVIICHWTHSVVARFMFVAQDLNMVSGDYAFIRWFPRSTVVNTVLNTAFMTGENITYRREAFYALKQITLDDGSNQASITELLSQINQRNQQPPWNTMIPSNAVPFNDMVNSPLYVYDMGYLYAMVISQMLDQGLDYRDGRQFFNSSIGQTFQGKTGTVKINANGDRTFALIFWSYDPSSTVYRSYLTIDLLNNGNIITHRTDVVWGKTTMVPVDTPPCGFFNELCPPKQNNELTTVIIPVIVAVTVVLAIAISLTYVIRSRLLEMKITQMIWKINFNELDIMKHGHTSMSMNHVSGHNTTNHSSALTVSSHIAAVTDYDQGELHAMYKGVRVVLMKMLKQTVNLTSRLDLIYLINLKELSHDNVQTFLGACVEPERVFYVLQRCSRGLLRHLLDDEDIKLDWFFRMSLINDLVNGMTYLHKSPINSHGDLSSMTCKVDNRWSLKIQCPVLAAFRLEVPISEDDSEIGKGDSLTKEDESDLEKYRIQLWTAPELLRMNIRPVYGTQKGDVYSFAIIAQEIAYRAPPYFMEEDESAKDIITKLLSEKSVDSFRPTLPSLVTAGQEASEVEQLIRAGWSHEPSDRPSFDEISKILKKLNKGRSRDIVDIVLEKLEKYANNLESLVEQRTSELVEEKKKTDSLLNRMLPPSVADELKLGRTVPAEMFSGVSIYFSDIVGFTTLSSESTPMQVVQLLNDLYVAFDDAISRHDVYKVETIGDAYMVVSGLPVRNGDKHIQEICNMALDLLHEASVFKIRHKPDAPLKIRIGVHTGSCAAGVVGHTMPRYCLFGDTVNVASRMESTGEAYKIHLSTEAHAALHVHPEYQMEMRGETYVKGKGNLATYWLLGRIRENE